MFETLFIISHTPSLFRAVVDGAWHADYARAMALRQQVREAAERERVRAQEEEALRTSMLEEAKEALRLEGVQNARNKKREAAEATKREKGDLQSKLKGPSSPTQPDSHPFPQNT
jgi:ATPase subunit of ABC transporter with duplicated ATPase domains